MKLSYKLLDQLIENIFNNILQLLILLIYMSTTTKPNIKHEHQLEHQHSPRKSIEEVSSHQNTLHSQQLQSEQFSQNDSSFDEKQLLQLEIKQIKRENQFLKKKISQLMRQIKSNQPPNKCTNKNKGIPTKSKQQNKQPINATIQFFFEQINHLVKSVVELFKVQDVNSNQLSLDQNQYPSNSHVFVSKNPAKNYAYYQKNTMNRKLQKIMLSSQQNKYPQLLEVFTSFYKMKQECDVHVKQYVDGMSQKVLKLNKTIVEKAHNRKSVKGASIRGSMRSLKESDVKSQFMLLDDQKTLVSQSIIDSTSNKYNRIFNSNIRNNQVLGDLDFHDRKKGFKNRLI